MDQSCVYLIGWRFCVWAVWQARQAVGVDVVGAGLVHDLEVEGGKGG
jgi:hypothetical protein